MPPGKGEEVSAMVDGDDDEAEERTVLRRRERPTTGLVVESVMVLLS